MPRPPSYLLQVASSAIAVTGCLWASTQWAAAMLGNQPALGPSWITLAGWPVYKPWQLFPWWLAFDAQAPMIFAEAGAIAAFGGVLSSLIAFGGAARRTSQSKTLTTYGSARWADTSDVAKAGLLGNKGIILGAYDGGERRRNSAYKSLIYICLFERRFQFVARFAASAIAHRAVLSRNEFHRGADIASVFISLVVDFTSPCSLDGNPNT